MLKHVQHPKITIETLKKFIALVILAGTMNSNMENIDWMWHEEHGKSNYFKFS